MNSKLVILTFLGLVLMVVVGVVFFLRASPGAGGADTGGGFNVVTLVPIWLVIWVAITASQRQAKKKRKREEVDIYSLMSRLVDDLDADEVDYLKTRLQDRFGDALGEPPGERQ